MIGERTKRAGRPVLVTCASKTERGNAHREVIYKLTGKTVSSYRIAAKIGSGGMGVVYRAKNLRLPWYVALKFISGDNLTAATLYECICREARAASALNHPNVRAVYEMGEFQGVPFLVMGLLKGQTLKERIKQCLTLEMFLHIAIQICLAFPRYRAPGYQAIQYFRYRRRSRKNL